MRKDLLVAIGEIFGLVKGAWLSLIFTSVFYRIVAFTILTPLISGYVGLFFTKSGYLVIANEEIAKFFIQPLGVLTFLVIAACSLTLIALEQACLMVLLSIQDGGIIHKVWNAFRRAMAQAIGIHGLALRIVLRIIFYSIPFLMTAGLIYWLLLGDYDINYYLASWPTEFKLAIIGVIFLAIGLAVILIRYSVQVVYSLPILLFESKKPAEALRASRLQSKQRGLPIAMGIVIWGATVMVAYGLSAAVFYWIGRLAVPLIIGFSTFLVLGIGLLFLGFTLCQFLISIAATVSFSALVMHLYGLRNPTLKTLNGGVKGGITGWHHQKLPASGRVVMIGVIISFIIAALTGWGLLSSADLADRTEVVAHRGASGAAPENTMAAIEQAIADGAHWVEIDVQRTADDRVVVIHDRDLKRIAKSPLVVSQTPYAQLARIDVGSWFHPRFASQRIPTLEAVLAHCRHKIKVNIELKYYGWDPLLASRVIDMVEHTQMEKEIVVMSLKPEAVAQVKSARPHWQVGLLAAATLTDLTRVDADFLAVHSKMVTPGFMRRVHSKDKTLQAWTINDTAGMTKMFGMGVDALITDEPRLATRLLAQRAAMEPVARMLVTAGLLIVSQQQHVDPKAEGLP
jgi:glycerophosphoryl diester phosphodiesterase